MKVLDEDGNLFGVVNVIDVLAVLLVVSVAMVGISLLETSGAPQPADNTTVTPTVTPPTPTRTTTPTPRPSSNTTRYVTLELGRVPSYMAADISVGDVVKRHGARAITITDVYTTPARDGRTWTTVRAVVSGQLVGRGQNESFRFGDVVIRPGVSLNIGTQEYRFDGRVVAVSTSDTQLNTRRMSIGIVIEDVSPAVADALEEQMVGRSGKMIYAEIVGKDVTPSSVIVIDSEGNVYERAHPTRKTVTLRVELAVRETASGLIFQGGRLAVSGKVFLDFGTVVVEGTVTEVDDGSLRR